MYTDEHTYICTHTNICIYMHAIYMQNMTKQNIHGNMHVHILNLDHGIIGVHIPPTKILGPP